MKKKCPTITSHLRHFSERRLVVAYTIFGEEHYSKFLWFYLSKNLQFFNCGVIQWKDIWWAHIETFQAIEISVLLFSVPNSKVLLAQKPKVSKWIGHYITLRVLFDEIIFFWFWCSIKSAKVPHAKREKKYMLKQSRTLISFQRLIWLMLTIVFFVSRKFEVRFLCKL